MKRFSSLAVVVLALSLGSGSTALAAQPGELLAFGSNDRGQLGSIVNIGTFNPVPTAVSLPGASGPGTQVAAGIGHSLALTPTGQLYAFGSNRYGQLGSTASNETQTPNQVPALVSLPGASGPVTEVAAGLMFTLALTSTGQLYSFGSNGHGQLGRAANSGTSVGNPIPALVSLPGASGPVTEVAAGSAHTLALTATGQLYAFGSNRHGQLGNATNGGTDNPNPVPSLVSLPGASGPVTEVAAGWGHSLALTSTGQLYAWGRNQQGELGIATNSGTETPNPVPALVSLPGASGPVTEVASGYEHTLALTATGQLYSFGSNGHGQLGRAANSGTSVPNPKPALVILPGPTGQITRIAAGLDHSLVLTSTDQLYAFGSNENGQLGRPDNVETSKPNPVPTLVPLTIPAGMSVADVGEGTSANHALVALVGPSPPDPPPTAPSRPATAAARALATAAAKAPVKNGKAMVPLSCPGPAACSGELVLKAKLKKKHSAQTSAKPKRSKPVKIGSASFSIDPGKKRTIAVPLKPKALAKIKAAGQSGLRAQLSGEGVKKGALVLKAAPPKPRRG